MGIMDGKRGLIMGVANKQSMAWGIAKACHEQGAEMAFSYQGEALKKRVGPLAPILKAKPKIIIASISLVFLLNAFGLIAFPLLATYLNMSQDFFGAWTALAIHDTASVVGAAMTYGEDSVEMATTIKLTRTLWLIPLMVVLSISYNKKTMLKLPIFVSIFICTLILSNYLVLSDTVDNLIKAISSICLFTGLFCIGTSIDKESIKIFNKKLITLAISLWMIAILISYILVSYLI